MILALSFAGGFAVSAVVYWAIARRAKSDWTETYYAKVERPEPWPAPPDR